MSKSRVCAEKTIKFAKQACAKKTNLLVYENQPREECCKRQQKTYTPPISSPQIKRIKICTGAELKKMCAPPPCPCPPRPPRPTLLQRIGRIIGFGFKSAVALGAVYVTYDMGIWGDSKTTGQLYKNICEEIIPGMVEPRKERPRSPACKSETEIFNTYERDPYCCDKFPIDSESTMYELRQKYNKIVSNTFSSIAGLPRTVSKLARSAYCNLFDPEACVKEEEDAKCDDECTICD